MIFWFMIYCYVLDSAKNRSNYPPNFERAIEDSVVPTPVREYLIGNNVSILSIIDCEKLQVDANKRGYKCLLLRAFSVVEI